MTRPIIDVGEQEEAPDPREEFFFPDWGDENLDPGGMMKRLVEELPEFRDLRIGEAKIMVVLKASIKIKGGKRILGSMAMPRFQGPLGEFGMWLLAMSTDGVIPDFIMTLDAPWWGGATPHQRAALVHHELMHAEHAKDREGELKFTDEGLPIWGLRSHDIEEFSVTVERFGDFAGDITEFVAAAKKGGVDPEAKTAIPIS